MRRFDQVNVIPFIDIMLVLLAIVLTTATFIAREGLEFDLPEAEVATPLNAEEVVEISIDGSETVRLEGEQVSIAALEDRLKGLNPRQPVHLSVNRTAAFGIFVRVINRLKAHHLERLTILTLPAQ